MQRKHAGDILPWPCRRGFKLYLRRVQNWNLLGESPTNCATSEIYHIIILGEYTCYTGIVIIHLWTNLLCTKATFYQFYGLFLYAYFLSSLSTSVKAYTSAEFSFQILSISMV